MHNAPKALFSHKSYNGFCVHVTPVSTLARCCCILYRFIRKILLSLCMKSSIPGHMMFVGMIYDEKQQFESQQCCTLSEFFQGPITGPEKHEEHIMMILLVDHPSFNKYKDVKLSCNAIWGKGAPPRVRFYAWMAYWERILTTYNLQVRGMANCEQMLLM